MKHERLNVALLGYGDPATQWGGTSAVTRDILACLSGEGLSPIYIFGVPSTGPVGVQKRENKYEISARRFNLNTLDSLSEIEDTAIISSVVKICSEMGIEVLHIQDYCGWPPGLIGAVSGRGIKVIVKIGNAWSLCPRLTLFSAKSTNCSGNVKLRGCEDCVSTFRTGNAQQKINLIRALLKYMPAVSRSKVVRLLASRALRPHSKIAHDSYFFDRRARYLKDLETAQVVHFGSQMSLDIYVSHGFTASNARVLNPSLHVDEALRSTPPIHSKVTKFGYIGGLSKLKGVDLVISAFRDFPVLKAGFELMIWGDGDTTLLADLPTNVRYMGPYRRRDLPEIMAQVDCGVLPSACPDVHPIVALEYAAAKRPVIMSSYTGTATSPTNIYDDLVFSSGSVQDLRAKLLYAIEAWETVRARSLRIPEPKTMSQVVKEYFDMYLEVL